MNQDYLQEMEEKSWVAYLVLKDFSANGSQASHFPKFNGTRTEVSQRSLTPDVGFLSFWFFNFENGG